MKAMKRGTAFLLAVLMMISAGCGGDTSWVFRSGEDVISAGMYIIGQINGFSEAMAKLAEENENNTEFVMPDQKAFLKTTVDGKQADIWINDAAKDFSRELIAVNRRFASLSLTLDESDNAFIENSISSAKSQNGDFYSKSGVSDESLRQLYAFARKRSKLFRTLYEEGGEFAVPESGLKDYFNENYGYAELLPVSIPYLVPEGETRSLAELREEAKANADRFQKRAEEGEAMEILMHEWNTELSSSEEPLPTPTKEEISVLVSGNDRQEYGEEFVDAIINVNPGEVGQFESMGYIFVYKGRDVFEDPELFESQRYMILIEMKTDAYEAKLKEWGNEIVLEENVTALNRYKPGNIKFPEA
ncbi:MAG: hypothetical protein FWG94_09315 [Oscillospiraceae bacterium]|nr:hypothetical protein [Oscillospiraceae bacterium]